MRAARAADDVGSQILVRHRRSANIHIQARGLHDPAHEGAREATPEPSVKCESRAQAAATLVSGSEFMMSLTSGPLVRAYHRWYESHATANPTAAEVCLEIASSASVRSTAEFKREAGDA